MACCWMGVGPGEDSGAAPDLCDFHRSGRLAGYAREVVARHERQAVADREAAEGADLFARSLADADGIDAARRATRWTRDHEGPALLDADYEAEQMRAADAAIGPR